MNFNSQLKTPVNYDPIKHEELSSKGAMPCLAY